MTAVYGYSVPFEDFLPEVLQFTPDVPEHVAVNAVRNACIDFCAKTRYWQYTVPSMSTVDGKANYVLETPADTKMVGISFVYYDTNLLVPKGADELADIYRMGNWQALKGQPQYYTQVILPEIILVPTPYQTKTAVVSARVALAPTRSSTDIDASIYENYLVVIAHGAKAILYSTPGQPYYDKVLARESEIAFRAGIANAKIALSKGLTRASTRAEFQRFV
jgi:hypothetical protein